MWVVGYNQDTRDPGNMIEARSLLCRLETRCPVASLRVLSAESIPGASACHRRTS